MSNIITVGYVWRPMSPNKFTSKRVKSYPVFSHIKYDNRRTFVATILEAANHKVSVGRSHEYMDLDVARMEERCLPIVRDLEDTYPGVAISIEGILIPPTSKSDQTAGIVLDVTIPEPYERRMEILSEYLYVNPTNEDPLRLVEYRVHDNLESIHERLAEGKSLIIRDPTSLYINGRTNAMLELNTK